MKYKDKTLSGTVNLDGEEFVNCMFEGATLIYSGGELPTIKGCVFDTFRFEFQGAAANTMAFLKKMASPGSGLQRVIRDTFPTLGMH